jgi:tetratricopeptide (TPR) repeat protein
MGFLDTLLRAVAGQPGDDEPDEPGRLRLEVVRLYEQGLYHEAEAAARRLIEHQQEAVGEDHPDYATALSNLALLLQAQGDLDGAEPLLRRVARIRGEALGERHPDYATSLNNLALLLCERHDYAGAEPLLHQAIEIRRGAVGEDHPDYATSLSSLALLLSARHDLDGAEPLLRQAVQIRASALGEHHPDYATSLNNLGLLLAQRDDADGAEPLLRQTLELRRTTLGEHHPDTVSTASALAALLIRTGREFSQDEPFGPSTAASTLDDEAAAAAPAATAPDGLAGLGRLDRFGEAGSALEGGEGTARDLGDELTALGIAFAEASEGLLQEASRLQDPGLPPDLLVLAAASACHRKFMALRSRVHRLAEHLGVRTPPVEHLASLHDLAALLEAVGREEAVCAEREQVRRRALDLLDHVLGLTSPTEDLGPALVESHAQARVLRDAVTAARASELPADADRLVAGAHPLAALAALADDREDLTEEAWADRFEGVSIAFGRPLAVAAARGRLGRREGPPSVGAAAGSGDRHPLEATAAGTGSSPLESP